MEGSAREAPFCKNIFFCFQLRRRKDKKNREVREKRGSRDSIVVQAHIVKRHFILIQTEQFFMHVVVHVFVSS
jgi:hypothetical protein